VTALRAEGITAGYGKVPIVSGISVEVADGALAAIVGPNGAGKSTLAKAVAGVIRPDAGRIFVGDQEISGLPCHLVVRRGLAYVPQNGNVFPTLTVTENLEMGAFTRRGSDGTESDLSWVLGLFPRLGERLRQEAGTLSGGEQQMLAMGRALMGRPRVIIMDEPSMGLAPVMVESVFELIVRMNELGITVFMVEQNATLALSIADRGYVIQNGRIVLADTADRLLGNAQMRTAYLGE